uniref:LFRFamide-2 n=1 Tax=Ambigolimax valentianus TaxID=1338344 RepID=A0A2Z6C465_9EUPU|nr:LFRFamide-2 [Ambigolimax valentianus]
MDYRVLTVSLSLSVLVLLCCSVIDVSRAQGLNGDSGLMTHEHKKRSVRYNFADNENVLVDRDEALFSSLADEDQEKRGGLFRFGKRHGSLFRFGKRQEDQFDSDKRGSLFRFGKRYGNLFRFGKRGGSLFRFGRSGVADFNDENLAQDKRTLFRFGRSGVADFKDENLGQDKRTLFRFGKRSDIDSIQDSLAQFKDLKSLSNIADLHNKHVIDNADWSNRFEHD